MKQIVKLVIALLIFAELPAKNACAAPKNGNEMTLIVTSDGSTKDEAIKNALRNAIEQTYGVFVSANTDILNDDIVKDEIATISSGNIKKYTEISSVKNADGTNTVTVEAIVSVGKLINYAKSKGAECELDGDAMVNDIQLKILYKNNEEKAVENLISALKNQLIDCFDYSISMDKISFSEEEASWAHGYNIPDYTTTYDEENVSVPYKVSATLNMNGENVFNTFFKNLALIGKPEPTDEERIDLQKKAEKEISKIKQPRPGMILSAKSAEKFEKKMEEYQKQISAIYEKYGIYNRGNEPSIEFPAYYTIPAKNNNRTIFFRSKKSVERLKKFLECSHICELNEFLKNFYITLGDNKEVNTDENAGRRGHRACQDYALQFNMWHGLPSFITGQKFYFYLDKVVLPQSELRQIKNVQLKHR